MSQKSKLYLIFFDHQAELLGQYQTIIGEHSTTAISTFFVESDAQELVAQSKIDIIVSPANSAGVMDGGIDMVYMQMFPGIQNRVQDRIKSFDITTSSGCYVLPVGSAIFVHTGSQQCPLLACVPTMFLPEPIVKTRNVYWAMRGLLRLLSQYSYTFIVAIPCMGTGVGQMTGEQSAQQVKEAIQDHLAGSKVVAENEDVVLWRDHNSVLPLHGTVLTGMACKQPSTRESAEISGVVK